MGYQHLEITQDGHVATLWLNRPEKRNAMSEDMWSDIPPAVADLNADDAVRVIVLAGRGSSFTVGIDVNMLANLQPQGRSGAEANMILYEKILELQQTASCFADSPKPVVVAVHGYCLGAGIDLISACDIRLATSDAVFSIRETKMGLVADIGSLQRLPAIVGAGVTAEMAYTGADYPADWAKKKGLVNEIYEDGASLMAAAQTLAGEIAANSPLVTQGIKSVLAAGEGKTVDEALKNVALWNSSFLFSNDLLEAVNAFMEKRDPDFTGT
jgi:enoyl-CoA hydratase